MLNQFDYRFVYSPGKDNVQSDFLSRLPLNHSIPVCDCEPCEIICSVNNLNDTLISYDVVKQYTDQDPDFQLICGFIKNGCPRKIGNDSLNSIKSLIPQMTLCNGCVLYNNRVFLPPAF